LHPAGIPRYNEGMNDTTWTCDRCDEVNDISDVTVVEHAADICEVVCHPCMANQHREEMTRANEEMLACFQDEI